MENSTCLSASQKCLGVAVRVQDTPCVVDDVSKLSLWTVTLSQWESVEIGERGRREEQQEQKGTLEGLFLWVTVLLVLSPCSSSRKPDGDRRRRKKTVAFYSTVSPISLLFQPPPFLIYIGKPSLAVRGWMVHPETVMEIIWTPLSFLTSSFHKPTVMMHLFVFSLSCRGFNIFMGRFLQIQNVMLLLHQCL